MAFIIDDIINAVGAANASAAQEKNARDAMALQKEIWGQQRADQAPWLQAGKTSLADMMRMLSPGYDPSELANDPGFQFRMAEGQKALERSAAARGGLNSGGFMKGLARYSQGLASDEFGNRFNRLGTLAGWGQNSAQNLGALGGHYANSMSNLYGELSDAQAGGALGTARGLSGAVGSLGGLALGGMGGGGWSLGNLANNMFGGRGILPMAGEQPVIPLQGQGQPKVGSMVAGRGGYYSQPGAFGAPQQSGYGPWFSGYNFPGGY